MSNASEASKDPKAEAKKQKMEASLEKLVDTQKLTGSAFKAVVRCKKCGWQTLTQDEEDGKKLVLTHAGAHWPEIEAYSHE